MEPSGKNGRGGEVSLAAPGHDGMPVRSRPTTALAIWSSERHGPIAVDENGQPFQRRYYIQLYSELAKAAAVPNEVWNMRARHGGVSEAKDAGADPIDIGKHAQHSNLQTTYKHYIVPNVETSRRVARARVVHRESKKKTV
jgi:hypothetical protein